MLWSSSNEVAGGKAQHFKMCKRPQALALLLGLSNQMRVIIQRAIWGVIVVVALVYGGDYFWARQRMRGVNSSVNPGALGTVMVHREYDVPRKDGRVEFDMEPPEAQTCIHAIFSHFGYEPCWYLQRHARVVASD